MEEVVQDVFEGPRLALVEPVPSLVDPGLVVAEAVGCEVDPEGASLRDGLPVGGGDPWALEEGAHGYDDGLGGLLREGVPYAGVEGRSVLPAVVDGGGEEQGPGVSLGWGALVDEVCVAEGAGVEEGLQGLPVS
ncbi:hypothetical protein ES703_14000 [subsurface metagenome]